ncbi:MAG: hypothetical protein OXC07_10885 [Kistimonas sp.]|nr:hypothetical protein [Kistimonas sp.]
MTGSFPVFSERNQLGRGDGATGEVAGVVLNNTGIISLLIPPEWCHRPTPVGGATVEKVIQFHPETTALGGVRWSCHAMGLEEALVPRSCCFG